MRSSVAVIVVDWNSGDLVQRCLTAVARQTVRPRRTIVIDNASEIETSHRLQVADDRIQLVKMSKNVGFAAGNNQGIGLATDVDWIALLNPDAFPEPDWLENLLTAATAHPSYSFFASRQVMADDPSRLDGTGDCYAVSGLAWRRDHGQPSMRRREERGEVFGACAAAALYRRDALIAVGGFDESFFCYFEDVDLAFRLRLGGHRCLYVPDAVVHHVGSGVSGRRSDFSLYHGHRNLVWTFWKNMPAPLLARYWPHHLGLNALTVLHFLFQRRGRVILRAKRDALRGMPLVLRHRRRVQGVSTAKPAVLRQMMVAGRRALGVGLFD